jgi:ketosteroid isomerase-like protein
MTDARRSQRWLNAYSRAWESYDPKAIADLFSEDAEYRWHPWDEGDAIARGRKAIVAAWLKSRDSPGTYTGDYHPLLVHADTLVAVGVSRYYTDASRKKLDREYHNLWIVEFDKAGRCSAFTEWYMKTPKPRARH